MKKERVTAVYFGAAFLLLAITGCGTANRDPVLQTEASFHENDNSVLPTEQKEDVQMNQTEHTGEDTEEKEDDREEELSTIFGNVSSIGEGSIVIRKAFLEGQNVMVSVESGSPEEELVTVSVSENTKYVRKNVKNGGIHGESDVTLNDGDFSNLKEEVFVEILGYYIGEEFAAKEIVMSEFE